MSKLKDLKFKLAFSGAFNLVEVCAGEIRRYGI